MKKFFKGLALVLAMALMTSMFTACGEEVALEDYGTTVAATYGDKEIMLDKANFFLRYEQSQMESYYWDMYTTYYGYDNPWVAPYSETKTLGDYIKEHIMQELYQTETLCAFASNYDLSYDDLDLDAVEEKAVEMYEGLDEALLEAAPITQEQLTEWVKENALANLVHQAIEDEADTSYTDEEVTMYGVSYIKFEDDEEETTTEEETVYTVSDEEEAEEVAEEEAEVTDEETEAVEDTEETEEATEETEALQTGEEKANEFAAILAEAEDFDSAAETAELTSEVQTTAYLLAGEDDADDDQLYTKTEGLAVGESVTFYDKDSDTWVVAQRTTDDDEDAKETQITTVETEKKDEHFGEVLKELYKEGPTFSVKDAWKNVVVTTGERLIPTTAADDEDEEDTTADAEEIVDALQSDIEAYAADSAETEADETAAEETTAE